MNSKGFTMLEMMIVILVVALLFLLTVPNINHVMGIVQKKGCEAQLSVVDAAILQYFMEYNAYPSSVNQLIAEDLMSDEQKACQNGKNISIIDNQASLQ
jgi:competence protein ComGC